MTAIYLQNKLAEFCDTAFTQYGIILNHLNQKVQIKNIIGSFNLSKKKRVLLCAHWDTRPMADQDAERPTEPSDGANDGASGVGVLIEAARQFQLQRPDAGVDIIFFDAEDMGDSQGAPDTWCLGSQFWSRSPHIKNYVARFGILLDMVGPKNAVFAIEGNSWLYAQPYVKKVWNTAQKLGHGQNFVNYQGGQLVDDHLFINQIIGIPTLDIIHYDIRQNTGFGEFWHTHKDNMETIDKKTLKAVGETVCQVVMDL
jgi:Iap family predicted aminopeptidase